MADPLEMFGEMYGSEESRSRFRDSDFRCPFDTQIKNGQCNKAIRGEGLPTRSGNCSLVDDGGAHIICPHRFYEDNHRVLREVKDFIWGSELPAKVYKEIKLGYSEKFTDSDKFGFGTLDWLLINDKDKGDFIGVEIQSNATTGTGGIGRAINDLMVGRPGEGYGVGTNTFDTVKRFMTQFIFKGQLFDNWKMPFVAVIQDRLWNSMVSKFRIRTHRVDNYSNQTFLFFIYTMEVRNGSYALCLADVQAGRWIDFLLAYAVDPELLIGIDYMQRIINNRIKKPPELTL